MIPLYPVNRYRPTRIRDGTGGWTDVLGVPVIIYGALQVHKTETLMVVNSGEDVKVNDILSVKED